MTLYRIRHLTRYNYEAPVVHAHHAARVRPFSSPLQRVQSSRIESDPPFSWLESVRDYHGNHQDLFELLQDHTALEVTAESEVEPLPRREPGTLGALTLTWEEARSGAGAWTPEGVFAYDSPLVRAHPDLRNYAAPSFAPGRRAIDAILDLNARIFDEFSYDPSATDVSTPLGEVLRDRRGVCQDFAHLAIGCLRSLGFAARYVSGYLETAPPPGTPRLVGADASHAWAEVHLPGLGWLELDPTNATLPETSYVRLAQGRDFSDVSPLKGVVLGGGRHTLAVEVDVVAIAEDSSGNL